MTYTHFMSEAAYEKYVASGKYEYLGAENETTGTHEVFAIPSDEADDLIQRTGGDSKAMEQELYPDGNGSLGNGTVKRIDIENGEQYNPHTPTGAEVSNTGGGVSEKLHESVLDDVPAKEGETIHTSDVPQKGAEKTETPVSTEDNDYDMYSGIY